MGLGLNCNSERIPCPAKAGLQGASIQKGEDNFPYTNFVPAETEKVVVRKKFLTT
jgi:hypothetical protein